MRRREGMEEKEEEEKEKDDRLKTKRPKFSPRKPTDYVAEDEEDLSWDDIYSVIEFIFDPVNVELSYHYLSVR